MGKVKIAETLCRAGLHLGVTTVGRIMKEDPRPDPGSAAPCTGVVTAKRLNHVWHVDLTAVSTSVSGRGSSNVHYVAAMLFFVVFGDNVVRWIEGGETSHWFWLFSGKGEVLAVFGARVKHNRK